MKRIIALILAMVLVLTLTVLAYAADGTEEKTEEIPITSEMPQTPESPTPTETPEHTEWPAPTESPLPTETPVPNQSPEPTQTPDLETTPPGSQLDAVDQLRIDSTNLYDDMDKTYEQGYIPTLCDGIATIVLPLLGDTFDDKVTVTVDLGSVNDSPFMFGNYSQTERLEDGVYLFRIDIPLAPGRLNGIYAVKLTASYLNVLGSQTKQDFTVYVTINDGTDPVIETPNMGGGGKTTVETPKLFIRSCDISTDSVGGGESFKVDIEIENIGSLRAKSIILSYGSDVTGIIPAETNNVIHMEDLDSGKISNASFYLRATNEVLAGNQVFFVKLEYADLYGGAYAENRNFLVHIVQPAEIEYDPVKLPEQMVAGEKVPVSINVFNTGKSVLQNVSAVINCDGLIPTSTLFLGDIAPDEAGTGNIEIYVGGLSMNGHKSDYGEVQGSCAINYTDSQGEKHKVEMDVSTNIVQPLDEENEEEEQETAGQWWISVLVAFAVISITIAVIVTSKFARMMKIR